MQCSFKNYFSLTTTIVKSFIIATIVITSCKADFTGQQIKELYEISALAKKARASKSHYDLVRWADKHTKFVNSFSDASIVQANVKALDPSDYNEVLSGFKDGMTALGHMKRWDEPLFNALGFYTLYDKAFDEWVESSGDKHAGR